MSETKEKLDLYLKMNSIHYYQSVESDHVFVYNTSNTIESNAGKRSVVVIPLDDKRSVRVPATALPIDLTEQAPKEDFMASGYFRDTLQTGYIKICPDEEAFEILSKPENQRELMNLRKIKSENLDTLFNRSQISVRNAVEAAPQVDSLASDIDLTVLEALNRQDIDDAERLTIVKNVAESLTAKDWKYIYENGTEELKNFASSKLA